MPSTRAVATGQRPSGWLRADGRSPRSTSLRRSWPTAGRRATLGADVAERIGWVEGDLAIWTPEAALYDLVTSLFVHVAGSVGEMVSRLASGVAPGGTLLLVGHLPIDPLTGAETPAAGQVQVTVDAAVAVLDSQGWEIPVAEDRPRAAAGTGFDAVICARRRT